MGKNDTFCCEKRQALAKLPSSFFQSQQFEWFSSRRGPGGEPLNCWFKFLWRFNGDTESESFRQKWIPFDCPKIQEYQKRATVAVLYFNVMSYLQFHQPSVVHKNKTRKLEHSWMQISIKVANVANLTVLAATGDGVNIRVGPIHPHALLAASYSPMPSLPRRQLFHGRLKQHASLWANSSDSVKSAVRRQVRVVTRTWPRIGAYQQQGAAGYWPAFICFFAAQLSLSPRTRCEASLYHLLSWTLLNL